MNKVIKPFLDSHSASYELTGKESSQFEHLINYLAVRNYTSRHFDPADVSLGKGEVGIDGVAIIANDTLVTSFSQIEDFFESTNDITVSFVFTQSKTSESFDSSHLSHFFTAINNFLSDGTIKMNEKAAETRKIIHYIINNPIKLAKNPDCHMFFAYTGKASDNTTREAIVDQQHKYLEQTSIFDDITFSLLDSTRIVSAYRSITSSVKKAVEMVDCAVIPKVHDVKEAYIGIVKCKDFIELITNEDGAIISTLFEDNVRYFQGHNTINAEIQSTLRDTDRQEEFSILNNGVTIVAQEMRRTGNSFTLSKFQVINGCQTSFVLFENRNKLTDSSYLVLKIVSTEDKAITDSIVKTTNRQTPVLNEAFETLRDFHKELEIIYQSYELKDRLYYERRSKQYDASDINKNRIISFPIQTVSYVAVFLEEPQSTHRYYGELLKSYSKRLYNEGDVLEQYCMASMYVYKVDDYFRHHPKFNDYKKFKFHIALILRYLAVGSETPVSNSKAMKSYCDKMYDKISDAEWVKDSFNNAISIIDSVISEFNEKDDDRNDITRKREFTQAIQTPFKKAKSQKPVLPPLTKGLSVDCRVINWNNAFAYVEILDYNESGSIHIRNMSNGYIFDISDVLTEKAIIRAKVLDDNPHPVFGYALTMI